MTLPNGRSGRCEIKELVEVLAKSHVENPEEVVVTETEKEDAIVIELKGVSADMGKVIGRQGRMAIAIRTVVKAASSKSSNQVIDTKDRGEVLLPAIRECILDVNVEESTMTVHLMKGLL